MKIQDIKVGDKTVWGTIIDIEKRKDGLHYTCMDDKDGSVSTIPAQLFEEE
jgi:hypothetical protein